MYLSLVVPIYNEFENIPILYKEIITAFSDIKDWEVIFVDDGSIDGSSDELKKIAKEDPLHVKVIIFRRNFGQTAALSAGIDKSSGKIITLMDGDLQNDPKDIPLMINKLNEGYDVVSGWRKDRKDNIIRKIPSKIANRLIGKVTHVHLHDYGCTLKVYRSEVIKEFHLYGEMHRFIPAYAYSVGAKICELPVTHHPRIHGKSKYGLERTMKVILDLITVKFLSSYSDKPIYLFGGTGLTLSGISGLVLLFLVIRRIFWKVSIMSSPLFQLSAMIFILGFMSLLMGLIAELLARTYHESQGKPTYHILDEINFQKDQK